MTYKTILFYAFACLLSHFRPLDAAAPRKRKTEIVTQHPPEAYYDKSLLGPSLILQIAWRRTLPDKTKRIMPKDAKDRILRFIGAPFMGPLESFRYSTNPEETVAVAALATAYQYFPWPQYGCIPKSLAQLSLPAYAVGIICEYINEQGAWAALQNYCAHITPSETGTETSTLHQAIASNYLCGQALQAYQADEKAQDGACAITRLFLNSLQYMQEKGFVTNAPSSVNGAQLLDYNEFESEAFGQRGVSPCALEFIMHDMHRKGTRIDYPELLIVTLPESLGMLPISYIAKHETCTYRFIAAAARLNTVSQKEWRLLLPSLPIQAYRFQVWKQSQTRPYLIEPHGYTKRVPPTISLEDASSKLLNIKVIYYGKMDPKHATAHS